MSKSEMVRLLVIWLIFAAGLVISTNLYAGKLLSAGETFDWLFMEVLSPVFLVISLVSIMSAIFDGDIPTVLFIAMILLLLLAVLGFWGVLTWLIYKTATIKSKKWLLRLVGLAVPSIILLPIGAAYIAYS